MGPLIIVKNQVHYLPSVDDGTGNNFQEGYFYIEKMIGPFKTKEHAEMHKKEK